MCTSYKLDSLIFDYAWRYMLVVDVMLSLMMEIVNVFGLRISRRVLSSYILWLLIAETVISRMW